MAQYVRGWNSLSEAMEWDQDPVPTPEDVNRVMDMVRPRRKERESCRVEAIDSIRKIAKRDLNLPGTVKGKLGKVVTELKKARKVIDRLPEDTRHMLRPYIFLSELGRIYEESKALAEKVAVKRSGGAKVDAARMQLAAECAFDLLLYWSERGPTLTRGGNFIELASLLFKIATGKKRDAELPCAAFLKELEADGFPDAAERRRIRRQGKTAAAQAPEWVPQDSKS